MSQPVKIAADAYGWYLCKIEDARMTFEESGAVAVTLALQPTGQWDPKYVNADGTEGNYVAAPAGEEYERAFGRWYTVTKNGTVNDLAIEQLVRSGCWLDDPVRWNDEKPPVPTHVVIQMGKREMYEGKESVKPGWLYSMNHRPDSGIRKRADKEKLMSIDAQFGAQMRAVAASFKKPGG